MLSSHQKDIKKNTKSNVLTLHLFLSTGPDLSLVLILVALPPNISSVFRQDPIRLHISNFVYLGFRRIFPEWFSIHIVDKYWLHFRPQSIAAEVGLFHKTFSVQYSFNVLYLKDQVKTEWIHCIAFVMGRAFGLDAFLAHEKEFTQNFRFSS